MHKKNFYLQANLHLSLVIISLEIKNGNLYFISYLILCKFDLYLQPPDR